ncbi:unnamed protein product [Bursaphelenchus xylophilus]|uniref:(pine wood nematode) hypothetical protein n=1 Tax=Bursaphelenchus xylophilus TaxID=6326 RepID=A0A1I7RQR4_BURXY|nr:unnamed protein product [Bursaphelenchus xylophilus]CAG9104999.1 unnamed protein product [Bursaphelenchus xylophilus]
MFVIQLAKTLRPYIGFEDEPSKELVDTFEKAVFFVASNFTQQIKPDDAKYLYLRYKKVRRPLAPIDYVLQPRVSVGLASLYGTSTAEAMQQYIDKVVEMNIGFDPEAATSSKPQAGFSKNPSTMRVEEIDDEFTDADLAKLVVLIRDDLIEEVEELIAARPDLLDTDSEGIYPIHHAADFGRLDVLRRLLDIGASLHQKDSTGQTVLHYAACNGHVDMVRFLLEKGLNPNQLCDDGFTPKDIATDSEIIELFEVTKVEAKPRYY